MAEKDWRPWGQVGAGLCAQLFDVHQQVELGLESFSDSAPTLPRVRAAHPLWQVDLRPEERGAAEVPPAPLPDQRAAAPDEPTVQKAARHSAARCDAGTGASTLREPGPCSRSCRGPAAGCREGRELRRTGSEARATLPQTGGRPFVPRAGPEGVCDRVARRGRHGRGLTVWVGHTQARGRAAHVHSWAPLGGSTWLSEHARQRLKRSCSIIP